MYACMHACMLRRKCKLPKNFIKNFESEREKRQVYSEIRTSYFPFHTSYSNHSATATVIAAIGRYFCLFYSYRYNTTPPNMVATWINPANQYTHNPPPPPSQRSVHTGSRSGQDHRVYRIAIGLGSHLRPNNAHTCTLI
jgi:hypothetical protein